MNLSVSRTKGLDCVGLHNWNFHSTFIFEVQIASG